MDPTTHGTGHITLMAAGELRDALAAHQRGDQVAAISGLMSIDAESWQAIERRLIILGGSLPELLAAIGPEDEGEATGGAREATHEH